MLLVLPLERNPLGFCPISLLPFSAKLLESVFYTHHLHLLSSCLLLNPTLNRLLFPPLQKTVLINLTSALKIAASNSQCSWSSFYWPTSSFWKLPLCLFGKALLVWLSEPHSLPGFPGCLTGHLLPWLPQSLLLVPSHLPPSKHWRPHG